MKKMYITPAVRVEDSDMGDMICTSTVIVPGQPNTPPGARRVNEWDEEDDFDEYD